jgi:hypothetical protein
MIPQDTTCQLGIPSGSMSGDAKEVAIRTFGSWLSPEIINTPGGIQVFATKIDVRKALACVYYKYSVGKSFFYCFFDKKIDISLFPLGYIKQTIKIL